MTPIMLTIDPIAFVKKKVSERAYFDYSCLQGGNTLVLSK